MKMLVFYRSRECTNAIISSTKARLRDNKKAIGLDVEFVNLDKRNYIKVLSQMEQLPQFIYIWYDEEKIADYIKETYPSIEVLHFNMENSIKRHYDFRYDYYKKEYTLVDLILEQLKNNCIKKVMYQVDEDYNIVEVEIDDIDIIKCKYHCFETKLEAKQYCINSLKNDIQQLKNNIDNNNKIIKELKSNIKKKNTLL